jgi:hypothetical protein
LDTNLNKPAGAPALTCLPTLREFYRFFTWQAGPPDATVSDLPDLKSIPRPLGEPDRAIVEPNLSTIPSDGGI